jgi:predicted  nucleic acid-binding Zn-ribbon protein
MSDERALTLSTVQRAFADSERSLNELQERLRGVALAEETAASNAESIRSAADSVAGLASSTGASLAALERAQMQVTEACELVSQFLEATDLAALTAAMTAFGERLDSLEANVQARDEWQQQAFGQMVEVQDRLKEESARATELKRRATLAEAELERTRLDFPELEQRATLAEADLARMNLKLPDKVKKKCLG